MSHCTKEHHSVTNIIQNHSIQRNAVKCIFSAITQFQWPRSLKALVCGHLPAEIAGLNLARGMNVSLL